MLARRVMPTSQLSRTTIKSRDPMFNLEQELRLRNFSPKTIKSYLYYNKELLRFASCFADDVNSKIIKNYYDKKTIKPGTKEGG